MPPEAERSGPTPGSERLASDGLAGPVSEQLSAISVVVITLNEEDLIRDLLESFTRLDYPSDRYEVAVIDASADSTPAIIGEFAGVRLVRTDKPGYATQKNLGLSETNYPIVAFTDADCEVPADWLHVIDVAMRDQKLAAVGGNAYAPPGSTFFELCFASVGHPAGGSVGFDGNVTPGPDGIEFIAGCNSAYRRSALASVDGFSADFDRGGEDVDLSRRLRATGHLIDYAPELTIYHMPRTNLGEYWRWNIRNGSSKYNLRHPSLARLLVEPSFPLWSGLILIALVWLALVEPVALVPAVILGWLAFLGFLYLGAKPYPLLLKRHKRIGLPLWAALTVVPFLIYVRQLAMNIGQLRERRRLGASREATVD